MSIQTSKNKIHVYGSRSEKMWLVRTLKFDWMNVLQNVFYWKQMANVLTRQARWKKAHFGQYLCCSHASTSICLWRRFYVLLAVACLWMNKLNKTIKSVLVYADTIQAFLYFIWSDTFRIIKVYYKKGVVIFCDLNFMKTAELKNWH